VVQQRSEPGRFLSRFSQLSREVLRFDRGLLCDLLLFLCGRPMGGLQKLHTSLNLSKRSQDV